MRHATAILATVLVSALAACGPGDDNAVDGSSKPAQGTGTPSGASAAHGAPGRLPSFPSADNGDPGSAESAMRELLGLAAKTAKGIPDDDRRPVITVVDHNPCSLYPVAGACLPTRVDQPVPIEMDPVRTWDTYTEQEARGQDGNASWQDEVLAAYINYLMYRQSQRTDPTLLTRSDDADMAKVKRLQHCKQGNVVGPLKPIMSPALWHYFSPLESDPDFTAGTQGKC
ncbi:hypothetical protein [Streptomyces sp. NPDC015414]|uniref:hypothetical protein n=1 Tax=Streptomyces sp. NPDC015414 TaxID=3364957 RepID=UPI0036FB7AED